MKQKSVFIRASHLWVTWYSISSEYLKREDHLCPWSIYVLSE